MVFPQAVLQGFDKSWRGNRPCHKSNTNRNKRLWWQCARCQSCPKAVAVSCHRGKTRDSVGLDEVINLAPLCVRGAVVSQRRSPVTFSWPWLPGSLRQVLQIGTHIERGRGIAPNFPGRFRFPQAFEKPGLLFGAENGLRWTVFREIRNLDIAEADRRRRLPATVGSARIQNFHRLFSNELRKVILRKKLGLGPVGGFLGTIAALVGDDQFDVPAPAQGTVTLQAPNGGQIIRFLTEAVLVKTSDRHVEHLRRIESIKRRPAWLRDSCRLVLEERLIGRDFAGLCRQCFPFEPL